MACAILLNEVSPRDGLLSVHAVPELANYPYCRAIIDVCHT